ncbi:metal-dependent CAAX amino terminal membrane protease [Streptococcus pneumoniae]|nr:metal-dependent CAAX amino terminal membrane protease [Streptococcus pneumoniae]
MKEKSIWKELLNRAGWLLIFLLATILYQIPIGVTAILTLNAVPLLQSGLIVAGISIVVLVLFTSIMLLKNWNILLTVLRWK